VGDARRTASLGIALVLLVALPMGCQSMSEVGRQANGAWMAPTKTPWPTSVPWFGPGGRATQTAVAKTATAAALVQTATPTHAMTATPTLTPQPTATPHPTVTATAMTPPPGSETPPAVPTATRAVTASVTATATPNPPFPPVSYTVGDLALDAEESDYLRRLNEYRASLGLAPLAIHPELQASATWMAASAAAGNWLSHHDQYGRDPGRRMVDFGASPYSWMCEVGFGWGDPVSGETAFNVWHLSPGHDGCQSDPKYIHVGTSREFNPTTREWRWYTSFSSGADYLQ
jgi:uncharacterized protein YkwD